MSAESRFMHVCAYLYGVFDCEGVHMHLKYVVYAKGHRCRIKRVSVCSEVVSQSHTPIVNVCVCVCAFVSPKMGVIFLTLQSRLLLCGWPIQVKGHNKIRKALSHIHASFPSLSHR